MPESFTRRVAIVREFLDSIGNLDFDRVAQLLTEDAVMSLPFLPDLPPTRGGAAIAAQLGATVPRMFDRMDFHYDEFYEVRDADTIIAEYHSECPRKDGSVYRNSYITVFGFRIGLEGERISLYKEYLNPTQLA